MKSETRRKATKYARRALLFLLDVALVVLAIELATAMRYDGSLKSREYHSMIRKVRPLIPYFTALYMTLLVAGRTYVSKWRYAGARELARLVAVCAAGALITIGLDYAFHWCISRMVLAMAGMFVAAFVGGSRFMWKICREALLARRFKSDERVLIVGAGEAGVYAAKLCQEGRGISGTPVGFVSDEADMRGERLYDLPVLGDTGDIPSIIQRRDVTQIVIAMPDTDGERIADIVDACRRTRCKVRILSDVDQTATRKSGFLREVNTSDFLSRGEVRLDTEGIRGYLTGRVVLVTGGGGSIGSEICRQVMRFSPKQLIIFDIYENCAYELERELQNRYGQDCPVKVLIGSIRDREPSGRGIRPVPAGDRVPRGGSQARAPDGNHPRRRPSKTTWRAPEICSSPPRTHGVKRLVQLSTDKAVNPTNVMGATKRITEMLIQQYRPAHGHEVHGGAVRQRAGFPRQRHSPV